MMSAVRSPYFTRFRSTAAKTSSNNGLPGQGHKTTKPKVPEKKLKLKVYENTLHVETDRYSSAVNETTKRKIKNKIESLKKEVDSKWEPDRWEEQLANIRQMRKSLDAPVDTMGCEKCKGEDYSEKRKVQYLKATADILSKEYDGDIPDSVEGLVKLPGVGPKMAYLTMTCAWDKVVGIGVDVHVHRIANRMKWVKKPTKVPENTRKELEDWLPQFVCKNY